MSKITEQFEEVVVFEKRGLGDKLTIFTEESDVDIISLFILQSFLDVIDMLCILQLDNWHHHEQIQSSEHDDCLKTNLKLSVMIKA